MAKKILIVDDDLALIKVVRSLLESNGFEVVEAHDGDLGLDVLQKEKPDLIILDVQMPNVNGYTFVFEMKKMGELAKTPVIVFTSKERMADIFKIEGVKEYLVKPLKPDVFLSTIKEYTS